MDTQVDLTDIRQHRRDMVARRVLTWALQNKVYSLDQCPQWEFIDEDTKLMVYTMWKECIAGHKK